MTSPACHTKLLIHGTDNANTKPTRTQNLVKLPSGNPSFQSGTCECEGSHLETENSSTYLISVSRQETLIIQWSTQANTSKNSNIQVCDLWKLHYSTAQWKLIFRFAVYKWFISTIHISLKIPYDMPLFTSSNLVHSSTFPCHYHVL